MQEKRILKNVRLDPIQYGYTTEENWKANLKNMNNYEPQFTFYSDFGIAEWCQIYTNDKNAILETFNNVIKQWSFDYMALTEIVLVLNHKSWSFAQNIDARLLLIDKQTAEDLVKLYIELYYKADEIFMEKYGKNKKIMQYYYKVTD